jgi:hypothetical protein
MEQSGDGAHVTAAMGVTTAVTGAVEDPHATAATVTTVRSRQREILSPSRYFI